MVHSRAINASVATRISFTSELKYILHTHYVFTKLFREEFWFVKNFFWICANTRFFLCLRAGSLQVWLINLALCIVWVSPHEFRSRNVALIFVFSKNCLIYCLGLSFSMQTWADVLHCLACWRGLDASWRMIEVGLLVVCWDLVWISKVKFSREIAQFPQVGLEPTSICPTQQWL